jgi:hypothetical protein
MSIGPRTSASRPVPHNPRSSLEKEKPNHGKEGNKETRC